MITHLTPRTGHIGRLGRFGVRLAAATAIAVVALGAVACANPDIDPTAGDASGTATSTGTSSSTATEPPNTPSSTGTVPGGTTETATASLTATSAPGDPEAALRRSLLSSLTTGLAPDETRQALQGIEVVTAPIEAEGRTLRVAVTSGAGIYDLPEAREHVAAIYEQSGDDWVELSNLTLESGPTVAEVEVVADEYEGSSWIAVHGFTGAHSGTFELLQFDGVDLTSSVWWFSSMPGAATIVDLDGVDPPEIVLNATDPYVYCYACGVRAWHEVIYRWVEGQLVEVPLAGVAANDQLITDLTEAAALLAQADLWAHALRTVTEARNADPKNMDVFWLYTLIERVAEPRLADAGADQQPFMTNILAGEYEAAVDLMRPYEPAVALDPNGPLIAGTVAEGSWADATAAWTLDYSERALALAPDLAAAHAVRAFGLLVQNPEDWSEALGEMEEARRRQPRDEFYQLCVQYLFEQNGGAFG